jgi:hypothetical protein
MIIEYVIFFGAGVVMGIASCKLWNFEKKQDNRVFPSKGKGDLND